MVEFISKARRSARFRARAAAQGRIGAWFFPALRGDRTRADGLTGVKYSEWSIISQPKPDQEPPSTQLVTLVADAAMRALNVDLGTVANRAERDIERVEIPRWPGDHYRLLVGLAEAFGARRIVEIGTFTGASAITFLEAPSVEQVVTYDITPWSEIPGTLLRESDFGPKLEQRIADLSDPAIFDVESNRLVAADIIFMDGPKDGVFEYRFLPWLLALPVTRPQLLILDDVKLLPMFKLWRDLPLGKIDASSLGHWSGTGLALRDHSIVWHPPDSYRFDHGT